MKRLLVTVVLLGFLLGGCGPSVSVDQNTLNTLNNAISALNNAPGNWQNVLNNTINNLADKASQVAKEVQNLLNDSVAFVGIEARCNVDFLGVRIKENLTYFRDKLLGTPTAAVPAPWVCHFSPSTLELSWNAMQGKWHTTTPIVKVFGFDFSYAGLPKVELRDANNHDVRAAKVTLTYSTTYELQLNFQTEDFSTVLEGYSYYLIWTNANPNGLSILKQPVADPPCNFLTQSYAGSDISCRKISYGFVYRIDKPVVTQRETAYPMISFQAGETLTVRAGGCVQTGGSGATWKLYVNPQGDNSDRLYHGLISIPGFTAGLVRVQTIIDQHHVIGSLASGADTLSLGYEDDGYNDNGYYSPDNGTGNQCLGAGNAWVEITIQLPLPQ